MVAAAVKAPLVEVVVAAWKEVAAAVTACVVAEETREETVAMAVVVSTALGSPHQAPDAPSQSSTRGSQSEAPGLPHPAAP